MRNETKTIIFQTNVVHICIWEDNINAKIQLMFRFDLKVEQNENENLFLRNISKQKKIVLINLNPLL